MEHVEKEGNCRMGWACYEIVKRQQPNHVLQKMSALVIREGKGRYERQLSIKVPNDYDIFVNPTYKEPKWHEQHYWLDKIIWVVAGAVVSIIVGYLLFQLTTQQSRLQDKQRDLRLDSLHDSIRSLQNEVKHLKARQ